MLNLKSKKRLSVDYKRKQRERKTVQMQTDKSLGEIIIIILETFFFFIIFFWVSSYYFRSWVYFIN